MGFSEKDLRAEAARQKKFGWVARGVYTLTTKTVKIYALQLVNITQPPTPKV
jgi:hypothetical protein